MDTAHWPPAAQYPRPPDSAPVFPAVAPTQATQPLAPDPLAAAIGAGGLGLHTHSNIKKTKNCRKQKFGPEKFPKNVLISYMTI